LSIRKNIRTGKKKLNHTVLIELLTAHLLEKIQDFIIYLSRDKREIKTVTTLRTSGNVVKKNVTFFLIYFLHFKLHLMFNVNKPKDAARSGLSRYIPIIGKKQTIIVKSKKYIGENIN
jgi:hypothetical protein